MTTFERRRADPLADVLKPVRTQGTVVRRTRYTAPFSLRYEAPPPLTVFAMLAGAALVVPERGAVAERMATGDLVLAQGPAPYSLTNAPDQSTGTVLSGTYAAVSKVHLRLLTSLPPVIHIPADHTFRSLLDLMAEELADDQPGRQAILDRLLDLLLARAIRAWLTHSDAKAPAWYRALGDDIVGPALLALHDQPARPWTVASLAAVSDVSRAALARRFTQIVGEPPLTYLTCWRMTLAAEMLRQRETTVNAVAREVGYTDAFAFSTAFKRAHGMSPSDFRGTL